MRWLRRRCTPIQAEPERSVMSPVERGSRRARAAGLGGQPAGRAANGRGDRPRQLEPDERSAALPIEQA
jgi:hypothetical protein